MTASDALPAGGTSFVMLGFHISLPIGDSRRVPSGIRNRSPRSAKGLIQPRRKTPLGPARIGNLRLVLSHPQRHGSLVAVTRQFVHQATALRPTKIRGNTKVPAGLLVNPIAPHTIFRVRRRPDSMKTSSRNTSSNSLFGATWDGRGTQFAVFSQHAEAVELCLFGSNRGETERRVPLLREGRDRWHAYIENAGPGQRYGFRAFGPFRPDLGHRFNPQKLLLDPFAKAITGRVPANGVLLDFDSGPSEFDQRRDERDSASIAPRSIVIDSSFHWGDDLPPRTDWRDTVIYECHVKGMTVQHPDVPVPLRGTYLGLASDPILDHLRGLGVTAVELLPIQHFVDQQEVQRRGLRNYWGYNTIGYFAPEARYATGDDGRQVAEFKEMVLAFHRAGIEVILDVVYNHTGEGDRFGPTLCFRGLDHLSYYRLNAEDPREYNDVTGCGNTLNVRHPRVFQMLMDSLRYWVEEMHVDGFRLDLTPALLRGPQGADPFGALALAVAQDPVLGAVKWIAEPWDLGPGGYKTGKFPPPWAEWNDKYRDTVRRFWRGDAGQVAHLAGRITGSSDLFSGDGRGPLSSINFVTCHDGFSLTDLVNFERKHNTINGEDNRDGADHNYSRNWGVEGPTDRAEIVRMRERVKRSLMATLAFSLGVPMLSHGDEIDRTQQGNNNAWCQDSEISWLNWVLDDSRRGFSRFVREVLALRREFPCFRRDTFFRGRFSENDGAADVLWLREDGREMTEEDWHDARRHVFGLWIQSPFNDELNSIDRTGPRCSLLLLLNGGAKSCHYPLPQNSAGLHWLVRLDTAERDNRAGAVSGPTVDVPPRTLILLEALLS